MTKDMGKVSIWVHLEHRPSSYFLLVFMQKCLLSIYYVPDSMLDIKYPQRAKTEILLCRLSVCWGDTRCQISIEILYKIKTIVSATGKREGLLSEQMRGKATLKQYNPREHYPPWRPHHAFCSAFLRGARREQWGRVRGR